MDNRRLNGIKPTLSGLVVLTALITLLASGCFTGYYSTDGASLEEYLEPEDLLELTENPNPDIWIIDVRPSDAYIDGHIPTALSYPSSDIESMLDDFQIDQYLIIYCETGGRAQNVITQLEEYGYTRMLNWGGYTRWPYDLVSSE